MQLRAEDLKDVAVRGWKFIDLKTASTSGASSFSRDGKEPAQRRFAVQDDLQKFETDSRVYLRTNQQTYVLRKKKDNGWQIERLSDKIDPQMLEVAYMRKLAFSYFETSFLDAISSDEFEFSGWQTLENGLVQFEVKNLRENANMPGEFQLLKVNVDPSSNCRVVETETSTSNEKLSAQITCKFEYTDDPFLPSTITKISNVSNGKMLQWVWKQSDIVHQALPRSEFTLAHYGLEEVLPQKWPWSAVLGYSSCAILAFAVCYFSVRYFRH